MKGYLKNGKIIFRYSYYNNQEEKNKIINFSTGVVVGSWNQKTQEARTKSENYLISKHRSEILRLLDSYPHWDVREKYNTWKRVNIFLADDILQDFYYTLNDAYQDYYEKYTKTKSIRKIKSHKKNWIDKYYPDFNLSLVNMKWFDDYMSKISHLADNTQRDHVKILKRILREARRSGHNQFEINEDELRNPPAKKKRVVWLEHRELQELAKVKPTAQVEQNVLYCWLFRAYTGIRSGEMGQVDVKMIEDGFITIYDTKKQCDKHIEVPPIALDILKKNKGKLPIVAQQTENRLIKIIARSAKLERKVYTSMVKNKEYIEGEFELYETLTTHDARRTFASICYREFNLSLEEVRELMQHADTSQTLEYIGATIRKPKIRSLF